MATYAVLATALLSVLQSCGASPLEPKGTALNPYLRELTVGVPFSDSTQTFRESAEFPVWSRGMDSVYFLNVNGNWMEELPERIRQIRSIGVNGGESNVLYEGEYHFLSGSKDGSKLATVVDTFRVTPYNSGPLVIIDLLTGAVDTIRTTPSVNVAYPTFTGSSDSIVFFSPFVDSARTTQLNWPYWGSFFVLDLRTKILSKLQDADPYLVSGIAIDGSGETFISAGARWSLKSNVMTPLASIGIWPAFDSTSGRVIHAFGSSVRRGERVMISELSSDSILSQIQLLVDGAGYSQFNISPTGGKLLFSAAFRLPEGISDYGRSSVYLLDSL